MVFRPYLYALQGDLADGTVCDLNTRTPATRVPTGAPDDDRRVLYEIIRTVSSSVDLEQVLGAIVELVTERTRAHATLIFIAEGPDEELVLKSVSDDTYRDQIGTVRMKRGEGLAGWVAKHREPVFIAENALQDPRVKYFPEFEEEQYQSIVSVPLIAPDGELIGVIALHAEAPRVFTEEDAAFVIHSASLVASAIVNARLYEAARRLGCDFGQPKLALVAIGWRDAPEEQRAPALERFRANLVRALPGVLIDQRDEEAIALVPSLGSDESDAIRRLEKALGEGANRLPLVIGVSSPCLGAAALATGLQEARQAALAAPVIVDAPAVVPYDGLGPYKYLLRVPLDGDVRDRQRDALRKLGDYDRQRQAQLTRTLEEFLRQRGNISATAQALYVHPNTLRQRLRRIEELTGINIKGDDWLMIEIALKLLRLEAALGQS